MPTRIRRAPTAKAGIPDVSCDPRAADGLDPLHPQCPPRGGDTLFANMYAAYESLSIG
jgi:hypothetical protein